VILQTISWLKASAETSSRSSSWLDRGIVRNLSW